MGLMDVNIINFEKVDKAKGGGLESDDVDKVILFNSAVLLNPSLNHVHLSQIKYL